MVFLHDSWKNQLWLIKMNICCILPPAGFSLFWPVWSSAFSPPSTSTSPCRRQRSSGWWVLHSPGISISPSKSGTNGAAYRCFCDFLMEFVQPLQYVPQSKHMLRMSNCSSVWVSGSVAMNCLFSSPLLSCSRGGFLVPPVTWAGRHSQLRWMMETNNVANKVWEKVAEHMMTVKWFWKPSGCRASCPSQSVLYTLRYLIITEKSTLRK